MRRTIAGVALLCAIFAAEMLLSVDQESQTFDESAHIYAGYSYWKRRDFGVNPEHPPFVKLLATLPLLPLRLSVQPAPNIYFRGASAVGGIQFLYSNDADALLFRARAAASFFALALALLVFFAAREMFGLAAAFFTLLIFILEPVIVANGALVTTDVGASACLFAAVYFFYRYVHRPSVLRLIICSAVTGLALAAKHSALIIFPLLLVLAAVELALGRFTPDLQETDREAVTSRRPALAMAGALIAIPVVSVAVLWSFYGFRYAARPGNGQLIPTTDAFLQSLDHPVDDRASAGHPRQARVIGFLERRHLLPEAYLYGLTDVVILAQQGRPAFVLGKLYPKGRWFYFPLAFVIKTSLAIMALLVLLIWAKDVRRAECRRAVLFISIPPLIYFVLAMQSKLQIGIRHILPIYPFLAVLAGVAAWSLARRSRAWAYVVAIVLIFDAVSSLRAFPDYLPYSNELWGGASNTHKFLSDSNVGWANGLKAVQKYLTDRHITHCWFAYDGPVDPAYYHIPCTPLPTLFAFILRRQQQAVLEEIQGPLLLGSQTLTGFDFGPGRMNAYQQFITLHPDTILRGEVLVFSGSFHVPKVAALTHYILASNLLRSGHSDQALLEAKTAAALDPDFRWTHELLASLYFKNKQMDEARSEYQTALHLYQALEPEFQVIYGRPENPFAADTKAAASGASGN